MCVVASTSVLRPHLKHATPTELKSGESICSLFYKHATPTELQSGEAALFILVNTQFM
jgi:hypothetical protein